MKLADFPELVRLSPQQRLQVAEALWDSAVSDALPVPAAHKHILRSRRAAFARGDMGVLTMAELKQRIRRSA